MSVTFVNGTSYDGGATLPCIILTRRKRKQTIGGKGRDREVEGVGRSRRRQEEGKERGGGKKRRGGGGGWGGDKTPKKKNTFSLAIKREPLHDHLGRPVVKS